MSTRANQVEILAAGVLFDGATIATPYAKFYAAGTTTAKDAYADVDKAVAITKKALDAQGRAVVYGDGIYKIRIYAGDPDAGGVLKFEIDNYKVTAVAGNTRTVTATTVTGSADDSLVKADTTSNNITYTLPDAALMIGIFLHTVKVAAGNTFTVAAASGQTVNGAASLDFTVQYSASVFQSDGSNWFSYVATNADTLDTYHASLTAVAGTVPVYNGTPALVGDITGNAATATSATSATTAGTCTGNAATATNVTYSGLTGSVPTWNQNTTGSAASCTGNAATATNSSQWQGKTYLDGSAAFDPGSLAVGESVSTNITVTGSALGDFAMVGVSAHIEGILVTAKANTDVVTVILTNTSAAPLDLLEYTYFVRVMKR